MVVFGSLIEKTGPEATLPSERISFLGMSFGYQTQIDVVTLFLAGLETKKYSLLLVDEFLRFNNEKEENIQYNLKQIKKSLEILSKVYGFKPEIIVSSDFMRTEEYKKVLEEIKEKIREQKLKERVLETVPREYRESQNPTKYTINEIACVEFLRRFKGMQLKIGPSKEKIYDSIMRDLNLGMDFAYVIDAYALGSREPEIAIHYNDSVVDYNPKKNGMVGQRLYLGDSIETAKTKLIMGPEEASRYLLKLASIAGQRLNKNYLSEEERKSLPSKKLKKIARNLVLENILIPYKELSGGFSR